MLDSASNASSRHVDYVGDRHMAAMVEDTIPPEVRSRIARNGKPTDEEMDDVFIYYPQLIQALTVCKLSNRHQYAVLQQGLESIEDIARIGRTLHAVREVFKPFTHIKSRCFFGHAHLESLFALVSYARNRLDRGKAPTAAKFTPAIMRKFIMRNDARPAPGKEPTVVTKDPPKLRNSNFVQWERIVLRALAAKVGVRGIPIVYVVRKALPISHNGRFKDEEEKMIYEATHSGDGWDQDNRHVGSYITEVLGGQSAEVWIRPYTSTRDGAAMMRRLRQQFLGPVARTAILANATLSKEQAFYRSEAATSFAEFGAGLEDAYQTLADYGRPIAEDEKKENLLKKIRTNNDTFNSAVQSTIVNSAPEQPYGDIVGRIQHLVNTNFGKEVGGTSRQRTTKVSGVTRDDFATRKQGEKVFYHDVDITEFTRQYPPAEWAVLPQPLRDAIYEAKKKRGDRKPSNGGHSGHKYSGKKRTGGQQGGHKSKKFQKKVVRQLKVQVKSLATELAQARAQETPRPPAAEGAGPAAFGGGGRR